MYTLALEGIWTNNCPDEVVIKQTSTQTSSDTWMRRHWGKNVGFRIEDLVLHIDRTFRKEKKNKA